MKSFTIPARVLEALSAGNPYQVHWGSQAARQLFQETKGPAKEISEQLVNALRGFPPPARDFDVIDIREGLGASGIKVSVATGTHIRVTVLAIYREAQRLVSIQDFQLSPRHPEKIRRHHPNNERGRP
jgi:hypothetical protein